MSRTGVKYKTSVKNDEEALVWFTVAFSSGQPLENKPWLGVYSTGNSEARCECFAGLKIIPSGGWRILPNLPTKLPPPIFKIRNGITKFPSSSLTQKIYNLHFLCIFLDSAGGYPVLNCFHDSPDYDLLENCAFNV